MSTQKKKSVISGIKSIKSVISNFFYVKYEIHDFISVFYLTFTKYFDNRDGLKYLRLVCQF